MTRLIDIVSADVMAFLEHNDELLNMDEGPHSSAKHWANPESTCAKSHPDFDVEKEYRIEWHNRKIDGVEFYYQIVTI